MSHADALAQLVSQVERRLAAYYGFPLLAPASAHLISKRDLVYTLGDDVKAQPEWEARAAVWFVDGQADEMFIGMHVGDELTERLVTVDPAQGLRDENLDAFCTVVEEVSHFHLILNRATTQRTLSKLELEWQGEIDKLLVCALTLQEQAGDPHVLPLARRIYDETRIADAADHERYWDATKYAARLWFEAARDDSQLSEQLREKLVRAYHASWRGKLDEVA